MTESQHVRRACFKLLAFVFLFREKALDAHLEFFSRAFLALRSALSHIGQVDEITKVNEHENWAIC